MLELLVGKKVGLGLGKICVVKYHCSGCSLDPDSERSYNQSNSSCIWSLVCTISLMNSYQNLAVE